MSWQIHCVRNDVVISDVVAKKIYKVTTHQGFSEFFESAADVAHNDRLVFNSDHSEHQDYVSDPRVQKALKTSKVKGDICFVDVESKTAGIFWGYRFDGEGGMEELSGELVWTPASVLAGAEYFMTEALKTAKELMQEGHDVYAAADLAASRNELDDSQHLQLLERLQITQR